MCSKITLALVSLLYSFVCVGGGGGSVCMCAACVCAHICDCIKLYYARARICHSLGGATILDDNEPMHHSCDFEDCASYYVWLLKHTTFKQPRLMRHASSLLYV